MDNNILSWKLLTLKLHGKISMPNIYYFISIESFNICNLNVSNKFSDELQTLEKWEIFFKTHEC